MMTSPAVGPLPPPIRFGPPPRLPYGPRPLPVSLGMDSIVHCAFFRLFSFIAKYLSNAF